MVNGTRSILFAVGALAGGAVVLAAYFGWFAPSPSMSPARRAVQAVAPIPNPEPVAQPLPVAVAPPSTCPQHPLAAAGREGDGLFTLLPTITESHEDPGAFLAVAREAAQEGRNRDAEVALIAACQVAERTTGAKSAPLADIKSRLGQHYATIAATESSEPARETLLQRASALLTESAASYAAVLGRQASKTRLAEKRLASLRDPAAWAPRPPIQVTGPDAEQAAKAPDTRALGAARPSLANRPLQRNEDLAQVDRDLRRLYAQARSIADDPAGVERRHAQALAQRQACAGDDACLRDWYAQRRSQLLSEF